MLPWDNAKRVRGDIGQNTSQNSHPVLIDLISDDEIPAPKRQKPLPPPVSSIDDVPSTPRKPLQQSPVQGNTPNSFQSKSPFKSKPAWLVVSPYKSQSSIQPQPDQNDVSSRTSVSEDHQNIPKRDSHAAEGRGNNQLSLRETVTSAVPHITALQSGAGQLDASFKFSEVRPIVFNPRVSPLPASINVKRSELRTIRDSYSKQGLPARIPAESSRAANLSNSVSIPVRSASSEAQHSQITSSSQVRTVPRTTLFQRQTTSSQQSQNSKHTINTAISGTKQKREEIISKLKLSTDFAETNPEEVERVIGATGFSLPFLPSHDALNHTGSTPVKKRKVDRSRISIYINPPSAQTSNKKPDKAVFVHPHEQVKTVLTDRFKERFDPAITFSNNNSDRRVNGKFQFIERNIIREGVSTTASTPQHGCSRTCEYSQCSTRCSCRIVDLRYEHGEDSDKEEEDYNDDYHSDDGHDDEPLRQSTTITSYRRRDDGLVVLADEQLDESAGRAEIVECDEACPCSTNCINRVVQKGRTLALEIFETGSYGFGIRSPQTIVQGQFIDIYLGEIITESELERREAAQTESQSSYVYCLDWFNTNGCYYIDSKNFGNSMRFVNHSCDPNARTIPVMNRKSTKDIYDLAFFAIKDIPAGTQITIDYNPQLRWSMDGSTILPSPSEALAELSLDQDEDIVRCLCGASNCRRTLWNANSKRKTQPKTV